MGLALELDLGSGLGFGLGLGLGLALGMGVGGVEKDALETPTYATNNRWRIECRPTAHLEVGHEREERHHEDRDHDYQADSQMHRSVRIPHHVVARSVYRLVHVAPPDYPRKQAGLSHEEVQEEPYGAW